MDDPRPAWLPTPEQALLLQAALMPDERAPIAWRSFVASPARSSPEPGAAIDRLLPLAVDHLGRLAPNELAAASGAARTLIDRAHALRRRTRLSSLLLVRRAAQLVTSFERAGVTTLILKGASLALRYYQDLGLRPMDDVDVLVHAASVPRALALLQAQGFEPTEEIPSSAWPPHPLAPNLARMAITHACGFAADYQIDLHWSALATNCAPGSDARFWQSAVALVLGAGRDAVVTRALCPEHELVHALVHGLRWNATPSIRWIADAATVVRATALDWDRVAAEVVARGVVPDAVRGLTHLREYAVDIPDAILSYLRARPLSRVDRWREQHNHWPWDRPKPPSVIAFDALRFVEHLPARAAAPILARYTRFRMAPDGDLTHVPRQFWDKVVRPRLPRSSSSRD